MIIISLILGFLKVPVILFPEFMPIVVLGSSLGIGTITNHFFGRKFKSKERLSEITVAKKQKDLLEDETIHQIKCEIAKNKMKTIEEIINKISEKNRIINSISSNYIIKQSTNLNIDEINNNIEVLKRELTEEFNELSIITKKYVLSEKFGHSKNKFEKFMSLISFPLMMGSGAMLLWSYPVFQTTGVLNLLDMILPLCLTTTVGTGYMIKKTKDNKSVFNKLNKELKENALSVESSLEEKCLEDILNDQIKNISFIYTELIEQQKLLSIKQDEENNKDSKEATNVLSKNINLEASLSITYDDSSKKLDAPINKQLVKKKYF